MSSLILVKGSLGGNPSHIAISKSRHQGLDVKPSFRMKDWYVYTLVDESLDLIVYGDVENIILNEVNCIWLRLVGLGLDENRIIFINCRIKKINAASNEFKSGSLFGKVNGLRFLNLYNNQIEIFKVPRGLTHLGLGRNSLKEMIDVGNLRTLDLTEVDIELPILVDILVRASKLRHFILDYMGFMSVDWLQSVFIFCKATKISLRGIEVQSCVPFLWLQAHTLYLGESHLVNDTEPAFFRHIKYVYLDEVNFANNCFLHVDQAARTDVLELGHSNCRGVSIQKDMELVDLSFSPAVNKLRIKPGIQINQLKMLANKLILKDLYKYIRISNLWILGSRVSNITKLLDYKMINKLAVDKIPTRIKRKLEKKGIEVDVL